QPGDLRRAPASLTRDDLITILHAAYRTHHDRLDHAVLLDRVREFAELGVRKIAARIARIGFEEFDRHLALRARPLQMRGLAADISDQTCKTAAQSRTRFVGHRQLPWIQLKRSCSLRLTIHCHSGARVQRANPESRRYSFSPLEIPDQSADADCPE